MLQLFGDLFKPEPGVDAICITTNGVVDKSGSAVMGAGVAKHATLLIPNIKINLGFMLTNYGNKCFMLGSLIDVDTERYIKVVSFPTKNHWKDKSSLDLIKVSCVNLTKLADEHGWDEVWLPPPGCGLGGLSWEKEVKPIVADLLDDRFFVVFR